MPKIIPTGSLPFHNQVIWVGLKVKAMANSPHIIVMDINRFLFFIFACFKVHKAKLTCILLLVKVERVEKGLIKG